MSIIKKIVGVILLLLIVFLLKPIPTADAEIAPCITVECNIEQAFPENPKLFLAIARAESNLEIGQKSYNCIYGTVSKACKREDKAYTWSVDCGILQVNVRGQICPKELLTIEGNLKAAHDIYLAQGLTAWAVYNSGRYKKYLESSL